jgi:dTDP-4-dehydrorhamnose reductase
MTPIELWAGTECTVNRVRDRWFDQIAATRHDRRLDDIDRFAALGVRALRFPAVWERLAPQRPDVIDWSWTDPRLARLAELGIRPIVGLLHHGSGPAYTSLVDQDFPALLARYARAVAERYPWVDAYTPVNEPLTTARFSALYGHWYPHGTDDRLFVRAFLNQMRAIVLAMRAIREINPAAQLVQTEDGGRAYGTPGLHAQVEFERERQWLTTDLLTGRVTTTHPLWRYLKASGASDDDLAFFETAVPPDIIGLNYYLTSDRWLDDRLELYPVSSHGGNGRIRYADVEAVRARPPGIQGHEALLTAAWRRYHLPLAITEVHLNCTREEQIRWLVDSWRGAQRARARGADVRAITAWALLGSRDWDSLVTMDRGHYETGAFDVRAPEPRPTASARILRQLASGAEPSHPVLARPGWWRRGAHEPEGAARPIVVIGARGTLGRAFERVCASRALDVRMVARAETDIADRAAVEALLREVSPWAVINAAGYVRVDDAEWEREACWRDNVVGPVNLADACRHAGIRLVTFSSDLVFDGTGMRPYDEDVPPSPRNHYGVSKAEAERLVLSIDPGVLVIRTSAFFGPWDEHNFAALVRRELAEDRPFRAAADVTVSPTYVPDLANATLDLLVDEERGIWHLANVGAITWADFGRTIAAASGLDPALVINCPMSDVLGPAVRPPYTPLTSGRGRIMRSLDEAIAEYVAMAPPLIADHPEVESCVSR